jgi:hypothetical protein
MDTGWIVLVEGIAIFGLLIGFGVWQLRSLKKMEREDKAKGEGGESAFLRRRDGDPGSAQGPGHPEGQHQPDDR